MTLQKNQIIGELVAQNYRAASVFKKHGIDFCCQGNRTIDEACEKKHISAEVLLQELGAVVEKDEAQGTDFNSWPLDLLADYIKKKHHSYVVAKTAEIQPFLTKICKVHGDRHPELWEIKNHFDTAAGELAAHMKKEELILFPFVRKMAIAKKEGTPIAVPHFGTVENPIHMMMNEHATEGDRFREIETLSNGYTPPEDACTTYKVTFSLLKEFEEDLHLHIHLENNILFPKAIALEQELI